MRLAVGIITWQDGRDLLERTIASLDGIADELLICDGAIDGIDLGGLEPVSDLAWLPQPAARVKELGLGAKAPHIVQHTWQGQAIKRTWLLDKARSLHCDWLLQIDADERLHNAAKLKAWLPTWAYDAFPIPFQVEPTQLLCATWKCLRTAAWPRVVAGGAYIEHVDGTVYCVVPPDGRPPNEAEFLPRLTHHPDERAPGRRQIRLGELEEILEPPPRDCPPWIVAGLSPKPLLASPSVSELDVSAQWHCDQCGQRFAGPGFCDNGHPPAEVKPITADAGEPVSPSEPGGSVEDDLTVTAAEPAEAQPDAGTPPIVTNPDTPDAAASIGEDAELEPGAVPELDEPAPVLEGSPDLPAAPPLIEDATAPVDEAPSLAVQAGPLIAAGRATLDELANLIANA